MKKLLMLLMVGTLIIGGCKKEKPLEPTKNYNIESVEINGVTYNKVSGTIDEDYTFNNESNWMLSGGVLVANNATLTIEYGTQIVADESTTAFLSIQQGAKIDAQGNVSNPIVFTSLSEVPGSWGGIIINGYADINTGETAEGEGGTGTYGGNNDSDNSGIIKYVRVEYAGKILGTDNELNGFSFNGVGNGTIVDYIEAYRGTDDGIEFFGGTVNVSHAVSKGNQDDSFDWTHGWRGTGEYWYAEQLSDGGDRGIEADNNGDDNTATPYSNPTISKVTLVGYDDGDASNTGIRLREGTKGTFYDIKVLNFPKYGIRVSDQVTLDNVINGELVVTDLNVYNNGTNFKDCETFEEENNGLSNGSDTNWMNGWTR
jgi:hypothetical protein